VNPPGGQVSEFWNKLCEQVQLGNVPKAFWVGFSIEQLATLAHDTKTQAKLPPGTDPWHPLDFSVCILRKRLSFTQENLSEGGSPSHSNYVCAIGCDKELFTKLFNHLGKVVHGRFS